MTTKIDMMKFVWAYMLEQGYETTGEWSYYGGRWEYPEYKGGFMIQYETVAKRKQELLDKVKTIGVDWEKTEEPKSSIESAFNDSFHDASRVEVLLGTIYLNDGTSYLIGAGETDSTISEYVALLQTYMDNSERVNRIFGE